MARVHIRGKKLKGGEESLRLDWYVNGERRTKNLGIHVIPEDKKSRDRIKRNMYEEAYLKAEYLRNEMEQRLIIGEHDLPQKVDRRASFIEYYDKMAATRSDVWQKSVRKHLMAFTKGRLAFGNVTEEWLNRFQDYLQEKVEDVTVCTYMGVITTCLNSAVRDKLIAINPAGNINKVRGKEIPPKYLTKEQLTKVIATAKANAIPEWFIEAFLFSCHTGLRLSDVETLAWGEVHYSTDKAGMHLVTIVKEQVKTQEIVRIPLTKTAQDILMRQHAAGDIPQTNERVFSMKSRTTTKRYIERWSRLSGVKFTYHSSRHTFGTMLQSAGVDINTTSKLMGHKSIGMTLRYAKVVDRAREEAIGKLDSYI